jgi:hypothetical protein
MMNRNIGPRDFAVGCAIVLALLVVLPIVSMILKIAFGLLMPIIMLLMLVLVVAVIGKLARVFFFGDDRGRGSRSVDRPRGRDRRPYR